MAQPRPRMEEAAEARWGAQPQIMAAQALLPRISWSAVFAGSVLAYALSVVLTAIAVGIGSLTVGPTAIRTASAGFGIWTAFTSLVVLFVASWIASRISFFGGSGTGVWHGILVWSVFTLFTTTITALTTGNFLGLTGTPGSIFMGGPASGTSNAGAISSWFILTSLLALAGAIVGGLIGGWSRQKEVEQQQPGR